MNTVNETVGAGDALRGGNATGGFIWVPFTDATGAALPVTLP